MKPTALTSLFLALASFTLLPGISVSQILIADSQAEFSGVQGQDDWTHGYRNLTVDGGVRNTYNPVADLIPFFGGSGNLDPWDGTTQQWTGTQWDLNTALAAPWTALGSTALHPNGTNQAAPNDQEHWAIRRWTAPVGDIPAPTIVQIDWTIEKTGVNGTGVTGQLHHNGNLIQAVTFQPIDGATLVNQSTFLTITTGDQLDLAVTPVGIGGDTQDGADGSSSRMTITTRIDSEPDGLADSWEETYFPGDLAQLFTGGDKDGDGVLDEDEHQIGSDPTSADSDGDGVKDADELTAPGGNPTDPYSDSDLDTYRDYEETAAGSDPLDNSSTPISGIIADSRPAFTTAAGAQGVNGWFWGYRNYTADGGATDYGPVADFIPFLTDGTTTLSATNYWNGGAFDWFMGNPPWTAMGQTTLHPNGDPENADPSRDEHWPIRRWEVAGVGATDTPISVIWHTRKNNTDNTGVTGSIHQNGTLIDSVTIAGTDTTGFERRTYFHAKDGDLIDLVLTPEGIDGSRNDGSDSSINWMQVDTLVPPYPRQPDGFWFIPNTAVDSEPDGLPDFWEEFYFPGDLTKLATGQDFDNDGRNDEDELADATDPANPDSDGDSLSDGSESAEGTDPRDPDSDDDGYGDGHEVATGYLPLDFNDNPKFSFNKLADSQDDFPLADPNPQGFLGWTYGYYDIAADGEPPANTNLIPFPTDSTTTPGAGNFWNGNNFDWFDGDPPWIQLGAINGHPDAGTFNYWPTRRWEVTADGPLALSYHLRKENINGGNGTSVHLLHNDLEVGSLAVEGTDGTGLTSWYFIDAQAGDTVELALSPKGPNGTADAGNDGSSFWLLVDGYIPANPFQPDGSPFGATSFNIISVKYDKTPGNLTIRWESSDTKEYQIEEWNRTTPAIWTPIGPVISGDAGETETEHTLNGIFGPTRLFHVIEMDP